MGPERFRDREHAGNGRCRGPRRDVDPHRRRDNFVRGVGGRDLDRRRVARLVVRFVGLKHEFAALRREPWLNDQRFDLAGVSTAPTPLGANRLTVNTVVTAAVANTTNVPCSLMFRSLVLGLLMMGQGSTPVSSSRILRTFPRPGRNRFVTSEHTSNAPSCEGKDRRMRTCRKRPSRHTMRAFHFETRQSFLRRF